MNGDFCREDPDERERRWKMSLADGIVREFWSGIISNLVSPPNPPVARNGNKRSNGAYVRHEDSMLIGIRRSPLRAARTVPMTTWIFMRAGKIGFRVFLQSEYRFRQSDRFFPKRSRVGKCIFMALLDWEFRNLTVPILPSCESRMRDVSELTIRLINGIKNGGMIVWQIRDTSQGFAGLLIAMDHSHGNEIRILHVLQK